MPYGYKELTSEVESGKIGRGGGPNEMIANVLNVIAKAGTGAMEGIKLAKQLKAMEQEAQLKGALTQAQIKQVGAQTRSTEAEIPYIEQRPEIERERIEAGREKVVAAGEQKEKDRETRIAVAKINAKAKIDTAKESKDLVFEKLVKAGNVASKGDPVVFQQTMEAIANHLGIEVPEEPEEKTGFLTNIWNWVAGKKETTETKSWSNFVAKLSPEEKVIYNKLSPEEKEIYKRKKGY